MSAPTEAKQRRPISTVGDDESTTTAPIIPSSYKATKAPKDTLFTLYKVSQYKASLPMNLLIVQSVMAGIYVAMAGHLYLAVGAGVLGAAVFPTGLIAVVLTSAELFTGDTLVFMAAILGGHVSLEKLVRNWCVSWVFNFFGCIVWASIITYASDALEDAGQVDLAIQIAEKKALQPWMHIFLKAIGANFMVCLAVWQSTCAEDVAGKVLAIWFPISGFILIGLEHVIANQFLIPTGMMYAGAAGKISVGQLLCALSAATLGNMVGGGLLVGAVYWYINDSMATSASSSNPPQPLGVRLRQAMIAFSKSSSNLGGGESSSAAAAARKGEKVTLEDVNEETEPLAPASGEGGSSKPAAATVDRIV